MAIAVAPDNSTPSAEFAALVLNNEHSKAASSCAVQGTGGNYSRGRRVPWGTFREKFPPGIGLLDIGLNVGVEASARSAIIGGEEQTLVSRARGIWHVDKLLPSARMASAGRWFAPGD
jgi:hypothetical protein